MLCGIVIVLSIVAFVIGDLIVQPKIEDAIADELQETYALSAKPLVDLHGRPFLLHLARREIPKVTAHIEQLDYLGVRIERADVELRSVRFKWSELGTESWTSTIDSGTARVRITDAEFSRYLRNNGIGTDVEFTPDRVRLAGTVNVLGFSGAVGATGTATITAGTLRVTATDLDLDGREVPPTLAALMQGVLSFTIALPRFFDTTVSGVRLEDGIAAFTAELGSNALRR